MGNERASLWSVYVTMTCVDLYILFVFPKPQPNQDSVRLWADLSVHRRPILHVWQAGKSENIYHQPHSQAPSIQKMDSVTLVGSLGKLIVILGLDPGREIYKLLSVMSIITAMILYIDVKARTSRKSHGAVYPLSNGHRPLGDFGRLSPCISYHNFSRSSPVDGGHNRLYNSATKCQERSPT